MLTRGAGLSDLEPRVQLEPVYRPVCVAAEAQVAGSGSATMYPRGAGPFEALFTSAYCRLADGTLGVNAGTQVQVQVVGFAFDSWGDIPGPRSTDEIRRCDGYGCTPEEIQTVPIARVILNMEGFGHPVTMNVTLSCSMPGLPSEIAIVQPAPNCPGRARIARCTSTGRSCNSLRTR